MSFPLSFNRRDYLTETRAREDEMKMSESNVILIALGLGGPAAASAVPLLRRPPPAASVASKSDRHRKASLAGLDLVSRWKFYEWPHIGHALTAANGEKWRWNKRLESGMMQRFQQQDDGNFRSAGLRCCDPEIGEL
jgi:hypothetical protein